MSAVRARGGAGGWETTAFRAPGAYPMLAIWAATGVGVWFAVPALTEPLGLARAMYASLALGVLGLLAGALVYRRLDAPLWEPIGDGELGGEDLAAPAAPAGQPAPVPARGIANRPVPAVNLGESGPLKAAGGTA